MVDVQVTGVNDLLKKMRKLPERVQKNVLTGAIRAAATSLKKEAQAKVPRNTGDLRKSIKVVKRKSKDRNIIIFSVAPLLKETHGFLAHFHEFGTSKMAASPFMRPAFENKGEDTIEVGKKYIAKKIDKEVAKL